MLIFLSFMNVEVLEDGTHSGITRVSTEGIDFFSI